jgi:hypothetical protein
VLETTIVYGSTQFEAMLRSVAIKYSPEAIALCELNNVREEFLQ